MSYVCCRCDPWVEGEAHKVGTYHPKELNKKSKSSEALMLQVRARTGESTRIISLTQWLDALQFFRCQSICPVLGSWYDVWGSDRGHTVYASDTSFQEIRHM